MELSDRDREIVKGYIDRGEPLPQRYKLLLFEGAPEVELIWQGKTSEVTSVVLPFQSIEHIDEPRAEVHVSDGKSSGQMGIFAADARGRQSSGWTNKLIWGDNLLVMGSLLEKFAGKIDLIYIDPPFATGADFSFTAPIGATGEEIVKAQSLIEEIPAPAAALASALCPSEAPFQAALLPACLLSSCRIPAFS